MSNTIQHMRYCYGNRLEMDPWRSPDETFDQSEKLSALTQNVQCES